MMMQEPSVLDYLKDKLAFWRPSHLHLSDYEEELIDVLEDEPELAVLETEEVISTPAAVPVPNVPAWRIPWRVAGGLILALLAQLALQPPLRSITTGIPLYAAATMLWIWAAIRGDWRLTNLPADERLEQPDTVRAVPLAAAVGLTLAAYWMFGSGRFTWLNVPIWLLAIFFYFQAFWLPSGKVRMRLQDLAGRLNPTGWKLRISPLLILWIAAAGLILFFRASQLNQVPAEMVSDHAEKLLDVLDVLNGYTPVYFPRNTGREFFQFYWTALIIAVFKTGVTFISLKIGTVLLGLLTLPYMYLLGKETGSKWVGFLAVVLCGIAYWPNVFSRLGLRFPLYPLFTAPTLFYLIRGLRTSNRNDFLLAGLALGIGLHGYTSIRILPFLVVIAVGLYLAHAQSKGGRQQALLGLILVALVAVAAFLPLLRYAVDNPDMFSYRAFSRLGSFERPLPGPAWQIFIRNLWNALTMFFWSDGQIWVHSVTFRPALDFVSAAVIAAGIVMLVVRYIRQRHWLDLFWLVSVPVLMLPSILSLAFPDENPSLNRTSGAIVPVFLIAALGLEAALRALVNQTGGWRKLVLPGATAGILLLVSAAQNYDLVFNQYATVYRQNSWNTSEMGEIIRGFAESIGTRDTAWLVGYPYWVDSRLVAFNAGYPGHDYAIFPDQIDETASLPAPKLFILNLQDQDAIDALQTVYPDGSLWRHQSAVEGKDFYLFMVAPEQAGPAAPALAEPGGTP